MCFSTSFSVHGVAMTDEGGIGGVGVKVAQKRLKVAQKTYKILRMGNLFIK